MEQRDGRDYAADHRQAAKAPGNLDRGDLADAPQWRKGHPGVAFESADNDESSADGAWTVALKPDRGARKRFCEIKWILDPIKVIIKLWLGIQKISRASHAPWRLLIPLFQLLRVMAQVKPFLWAEKMDSIDVSKPVAFREEIAPEKLRELLSYDPVTGIFRWKVQSGSRGRPGSIAGSNKEGYIAIGVCGVSYLAHRLAWVFMTNEWPKESIDHINGCPDMNMWSNLRSVSNKINLRNAKRSSNNTSGVTGVEWFEKARKWRARIKVDRKNIHLGLYENIEDAIEARRSADKKYGFHENHGRLS